MERDRMIQLEDYLNVYNKRWTEHGNITVGGVCRPSEASARALARLPLLYPPRQSLSTSGASEARKKRALLCLVDGGEAGVVEMGASQVRKKRA
jgi:hypothetical protein